MTVNSQQSHIHRNRAKKLTTLYKSYQPLQAHTTGVQKRAIKYFLEVATVDETRRSIRGERAEIDSPDAPVVAPKDSVKY